MNVYIKHFFITLGILTFLCMSAAFTIVCLRIFIPLDSHRDRLSSNVSSSGQVQSSLFSPASPILDASKPSGYALPPDNQKGWRKVFIDDFSSTLSEEWSAYNGQYGDSPHSYAKVSNVFTQADTLRIHGAVDDTGNWFNGGACLCNSKLSEQWLNTEDIMVTFRWRVVNDGLVSVASPKYAFLRWPQSERWPEDGEEDFLEGYMSESAGFEFTSHVADNSGKDSSALWKSVPDYDPTQWHTITYARKDYKIALSIDGKFKIQYDGSEKDLPHTSKHIVVQQVCDRLTACPTAGTSEIQIDWMVAYVPE